MTVKHCEMIEKLKNKFPDNTGSLHICLRNHSYHCIELLVTQTTFKDKHITHKRISDSKMTQTKKPDGGWRAWFVVAASFMISFIQVLSSSDPGPDLLFEQSEEKKFSNCKMKKIQKVEV